MSSTLASGLTCAPRYHDAQKGVSGFEIMLHVYEYVTHFFQMSNYTPNKVELDENK
jgi:hypothetical protein